MLTDSAWSESYVEDVFVGLALPALKKRPTHTMLFRFSAVTWNAHRIHYDQAYARSERHPDVLVQATMHGAFIVQMLQAFAGPAGRLALLEYSNRGRAVPGDALTCSGHVTAVDLVTGAVRCEIHEQNQDGVLCVAGEATVILPRRRPPHKTPSPILEG